MLDPGGQTFFFLLHEPLSNFLRKLWHLTLDKISFSTEYLSFFSLHEEFKGGPNQKLSQHNDESPSHHLPLSREINKMLSYQSQREQRNR